MSAAAELIRQARAELDREFPEAWLPTEQGHAPEIAGIFKRLERGNTKRFGPKWIVVVEDEHGVEWGIWLLHAALISQFQRVAPAYGEAIAVRYLGKRMNRAGDNEYDDYKVAILRNPGPVNWSAVADQHDAPPQAPAVSAAAPPPAAARHSHTAAAAVPGMRKHRVA